MVFDDLCMRLTEPTTHPNVSLDQLQPPAILQRIHGYKGWMVGWKEAEQSPFFLQKVTKCCFKDWFESEQCAILK